MVNDNKSKLTILWTNADPLTAEMMVFMYANAALKYNWWDQVRLIVWGATAKLVAENEHIQAKLLEAKAMGVDVGFCIACANELGVADKIEALGFELKSMGPEVTKVLKDDGKMLTI